jgi:hypothetical protein
LTPRERSLLVIFVAALAASALCLGLDLYLERLTRLDTEFITLQKRALRDTQLALTSGGNASGVSWGELKDRFYAPGTLTDPLTLASQVQAAVKDSGLSIAESRVTESSSTAQWVQYRVEGSIESWFRFLKLIRSQDPKSLFRSMSLIKKEGSTYAIAFEVGHAVQP